jgi:trk system potassium uptake protein
MRVVIAGGGSVGTAIAADLLDNGHSVQILEQDPDHAEALRVDLPGIEVLAVDACEVTSLQRAGLRSAEVVVAATGDDEDNLVISWLSKQEFAVPRVISRVNNSKNAWLFNESWGVDVSVSTPQLLTALVEEAVTIGSVVRLMELDRSGATLVEVTLDADAPALEGDTTVADLALPADAQIVAIVRDEKVLIPRDDTRLSEGDHVVVLATHGAEIEIERVFVGD